MSSQWKGAYGYDTKHSMYFSEHTSKKTQTDIGVGTRQQTQKRCGIVKSNVPSNSSSQSQQCETGTCPWR